MFKTPYMSFLLLAVVATVGFSPSPATGAIIDFEDGVGHDVVIPGGQYSGLTISNAVWIGAGAPFHEGSFGLGVDAGIVGGNNWAFPGTSSPIVIEFNVPLSNVSIDAFDVQDRGAKLEAFDASGISLGSDSFSNVSLPQKVTLSVASAGIKKIELTQLSNLTSNGDGVGWDNLNYTPVPEPATYLLCATAFGLAVGYRGLRKP